MSYKITDSEFVGTQANYHRALGVKPDDSFSTRLDKAFHSLQAAIKISGESSYRIAAFRPDPKSLDLFVDGAPS
jgi:hypothetical protein